VPTLLLELRCSHLCCITTLFFPQCRQVFQSVGLDARLRDLWQHVSWSILVEINVARSPLCAFVLLFIALPDMPSCSICLSPQLVQNTPQFRAAEGETPLVLLPGRPPARLSLDAPLSATGAVKDGQKQVRFMAAYCVFLSVCLVQPPTGRTAECHWSGEGRPEAGALRYHNFMLAGFLLRPRFWMVGVCLGPTGGREAG